METTRSDPETPETIAEEIRKLEAEKAEVTKRLAEIDEQLLREFPGIKLRL